MDKHDDLASFFPPPSLPMHDFSSSSGTQPPLSPTSLQNQLTMSMFGNMLNSQDQLAGQSSNNTAPGVQCNPQALLEQQFKLAQLQQLQQLQNQIFQQQIALISGQPLLSSSPPKDQGSSASAPQVPYAGLPTPGPSSELRPRETTMEFVSPMILNSHTSFLDAPQQNHHSFQHHPEHSFSYSQPQNFAIHPHTAPPQIAFHIQSSIPSPHDQHRHHNHHDSNSSPMFNSNTNPPPSSTLSVMTGNDLDISPITSPLFGPAGNHQQHSQHEGSLHHLHHHHPRSSSFSHHPSSSSPSTLRGKRPADDNDNGNGDSMGGGFETSEPVRKKQSISLWDNSNLNSTRQSQAIHHNHNYSLTPLTLLPQSSSSLTSSPLLSPASPMSNGLNNNNNNNNNNQIPSSNSSSSSSARRRMYKGSKSVTNTPLLTGQRSRMNSITRGQGQGQGQGVNSKMNAGINFNVNDIDIVDGNLNSMVAMTMDMGVGMEMGVGVGVGDTPSPVDLDMSMPPPPAPSESSSSSSSNLIQHNNDNGNDNSSMGMNMSMNSMGMGGMGGMGMMGLVGMGGVGAGEGRLLPVTPASIMKLARLNSGNGVGGSMMLNGSDGVVLDRSQPGDQVQEQGQMEEVRNEQVERQQQRNKSEERKEEQYAKEKEKEKEKAKGKEKDKEKEKKKEKEKEKEKEKLKEKEKEKNGGANGGTGVANGRTRRAAAVAANSNIGLKAILPSNPVELNISNSTSTMNATQQPPRKTSHKAAEQKRRDSLKSTFDDLRTLLPVIPLLCDADDSNANNNIGIPGAWPPRSSALLPGSLPPRGPPKSGAEGPNKGVSKLQLLVCGNEYIRVLKARVDRRDEEIKKLRMEVGRLRGLVDDNEVELENEMDLEKDLDAVELKVQEKRDTEMGFGGALGSVGEEPELEEEAD